jgi:hypothetical protein
MYRGSPLKFWSNISAWTYSSIMLVMRSDTRLVVVRAQYFMGSCRLPAGVFSQKMQTTVDGNEMTFQASIWL